VLIVHLGAIGAVVRSTALLAGIRRKYGNAHITWVTEKPSDQLLRNHPEIDRVLTTSSHDLLALSCLEFDIGFCIDKSLAAGGVIKATRIKKVFGFRVQTVTGAIVPATDAASELWEIGLSDQKKFFENKKSEIQLVTEALELKYNRDPYHLHLSPEEESLAKKRRQEWQDANGLNSNAGASLTPVLIGINTGCSPVIPYKKLTVEFQRKIIQTLQTLNARVVLLGGPEDTDRNIEIAKDLNVISSPTDRGLRDGLASVAACDIVISGDSLGMHMAIAMQKWTVAWFGPTCAHEIDLYDRGVHVLSQATCTPCWKRSCQKTTMCYDLVDQSHIIDGVKKGIQWLMLSSIPRSSGISSSPSPSFDKSSDSSPSSL